MRVLVMGGTLFNGYALVKELVRTGHDVTILNRGKTQVDLPRSVHRLIGDRTDHDRIHELFRHEEYDCVHDMSAYHPEDVELMYDVFRGKTGHYIFASSTVIYAPSDILPIDESFPVDRSERQIEYGMHKILCEEFLFQKFRDNGFPASVAALSMVFGPHNGIPDREQRMFARVSQGRKILIPGDGRTLGQVGHVDDQARALRLMMGQAVTHGRRYNLTGSQAFTNEGYVDVFARVLGVDVDKVFIPTEIMDGLWDGQIDIAAGRMQSRIETRPTASGSRTESGARQRYQLSTLIQRLAPHLHRWDRSVVFGIDRLRRDTGWEPEYTFASMVQQTYEWFVREGLDRSLTFDFAAEDQILSMLA
ncbi:MAG: NAD-dependent epimerase/dehydratase family protein [Actinobacteria bacterium]|jgi:nucleoside-diphosphate-sugar epimerase|nr:MAG: NAD-dependent epimerase/dehydratase family protein [Actinomycetota bacterium]